MKKPIPESVYYYAWIKQLHDWISSPFGIAVMTGIVAYIAYKKIRSQQYPTYDDEDYENEGQVPMKEPMKNLRLTQKQLFEYNSKNREGKFLIALLGIVYDVSSAPQDFGSSGVYRHLTGTDILSYLECSAQCQKLALQTVLDEWQAVLEDHFFVAGMMIPDNDDDDDDDDDNNKSNNSNINNNIDSDAGDVVENMDYNSVIDESEDKENVYPGDATILDSSIYNAEEGDRTLLAPVDVDQTLTNWNELDQTVIQA